jgi:hypothetical protein
MLPASGSTSGKPQLHGGVNPTCTGTSWGKRDETSPTVATSLFAEPQIQRITLHDAPLINRNGAQAGVVDERRQHRVDLRAGDRDLLVRLRSRQSGVPVGTQLGFLVAGFAPSIFTAVVVLISAGSAFTARETKDVPTPLLGQKSRGSAKDLVHS